MPNPADQLYQALKTRVITFPGAHDIHTPQALVEEILGQIPLQGQVLVLFNVEFVISLVYNYKVAPSQITLLSDHPDKTGFCDQLSVNTITELEDGMRFDVIVGNPPYQDAHSDGGRRDQASNLWSRFWSESFRRLAPSGSVCLITPTTWCSPSADLRGADRIQGHDRLWEVFSQYTSRARVEGVADHFPGVGSSFGYVWVDTSGDAGLTFDPPRPTDLGFLPVSGQDRVAAELDAHDNLGQHFPINQDNSPDLRVSIPMTRVLEDPSIEILQGQCDPQAGSSRAQLYLYVHVNTPEQAQAVRERIVSCLDILNRHCRWSGFLNIQAVRRISYREPG